MSTAQTTARVAVITGASSGIGEATARALATDGHRVALLARRADRIQALANELGNGAIAIEADVTDRDSIVAAAERVQQELGGADVLVNNAGVMLTAPFSSGQREEHRRMVETNLLGAIATELPDHITHADSKKAKDALDSAIPPSDIAIAFAVSRPQRVTLNEILVRPTVQAM
jgi:NADP-dependent 3-hydroxy acid dehydrogenase YdfG